MGVFKKYFAALTKVILVTLLLVILVSIVHFPFDVDAPLTQLETDTARTFYTEAYQKPLAKTKAILEYETEYIRVAENAAQAGNIKKRIGAFVTQFNLHEKPVLDIGSGRGYLQDLAQDYTGLDISPSVARFYHKKFVLGSATAMPFPDNSFEGGWSIMVFEHVPNPEQAFHEVRRVTRDKGVFFLLPAWNCTPWAADGYEVRPYSDFDVTGKITKASIPLRTSVGFKAITLVPTRIVRSLVALSGPTKLHYRRLVPNYEKYWVGDSDAVNSIDIHEAMLWFTSRGDECLNCDSASIFMPAVSKALIIRVHKRDGS